LHGADDRVAVAPKPKGETEVEEFDNPVGDAEAPSDAEEGNRDVDRADVTAPKVTVSRETE